MLQTSFFICLGYLSGSVLYARVFAGIFNREDMFLQSGDHNPGTANAFLYGGFWCGLFTLIFDILKGFLPVFLFMRWDIRAKPIRFWQPLSSRRRLSDIFFRSFTGLRAAKESRSPSAAWQDCIPRWILYGFWRFSSLPFYGSENHTAFLSDNLFLCVFPFAIFGKSKVQRLRSVFLSSLGPFSYVLHTSKESRSRWEVKLFGCFNTFVRDRRRT